MNARDFALIQLDKKRLPGWKPDLVHHADSSEPTDPRDRGLAEQIVAGVVKNLFLLQWHIEHYSGRPSAKIDPLVRKILAIGLYQLEFLDRIPASAAVDEAVQQTKRFGRGKSAGFVNAVLRNVGRNVKPASPDPALDPDAYAKMVLSHPPELFRKLAGLLGTEKALAFCRHDNAEPPTVVRLYRGAEQAALNEPGVEILPHEAAGMFVVRGANQQLLARWARAGIAQVQDPMAASVVEQLRIEPGQVVLDRCAGVGTKTLQIQEIVGTTGMVVAVDPSAARCGLLRGMLEHRGISNVKIVQSADLESARAQLPVSFDRILVDVPCSNSGVLARRPEARYAGGLDCLRKLQREILESSLPWLARDGMMIYSTCSVWAEENQDQVREFLGRHAGLKLEEEQFILPSFETGEAAMYHDGGYWAVISNAAKS
jgi:16S rRNA (cytosine967-C5)-methyltransferase